MSQSESTRRVADIGELDDDAQRLRVTWRKTHNFIASFAKVLMETKDKFGASDYGIDKYGYPWTFESWLGFKAGLVESQVYRMLNVFEKALAGNDRDIVAAEQQRIAEEKRANKERIAEEKRVSRAKRQEEKEQDRQAVQARKQAREVSKQINQETALQKKKNERTGTVSRTRTVDTHAIDAVKEAVKKKQLSVTRGAEIGRAGNSPELQAELLAAELANPRRATRPRKVNPKPGKDLGVLTRECRAATVAVLFALELDSLEARRARVVTYGEALLPIRELLPQPAAFNAHLRANDLEVRDSEWRSNAMWLAANWDGIQHSLSDCRYMNPGDIRKWLRQRDGNFGEIPKVDSAEIVRIH